MVIYNHITCFECSYFFLKISLIAEWFPSWCCLSNMRFQARPGIFIAGGVKYRVLMIRKKSKLIVTKTVRTRYNGCRFILMIIYTALDMIGNFYDAFLRMDFLSYDSFMQYINPIPLIPTSVLHLITESVTLNFKCRWFDIPEVFELC